MLHNRDLHEVCHDRNVEEEDFPRKPVTGGISISSRTRRVLRNEKSVEHDMNKYDSPDMCDIKYVN